MTTEENDDGYTCRDCGITYHRKVLAEICEDVDRKVRAQEFHAAQRGWIR